MSFRASVLPFLSFRASGSSLCCHFERAVFLFVISSERFSLFCYSERVFFSFLSFRASGSSLFVISSERSESRNLTVSPDLDETIRFLRFVRSAHSGRNDKAGGLSLTPVEMTKQGGLSLTPVEMTREGGPSFTSVEMTKRGSRTIRRKRLI